MTYPIQLKQNTICKQFYDNFESLHIHQFLTPIFQVKLDHLVASLFSLHPPQKRYG